MDITDYRLMLDTAYRAWSRYQDVCLSIAEYATEGVPGARAMLTAARSERERALSDFMTLSNQPSDSERSFDRRTVLLLQDFMSMPREARAAEASSI
jgi:hypothetical protein